MLDKATGAIPALSRGWRTPILIDNYNKQLTIYTDDLDYVGFTMYFELLITLPKGAVADRGKYTFFLTFLD